MACIMLSWRWVTKSPPLCQRIPPGRAVKEPFTGSWRSYIAGGGSGQDRPAKRAAGYDLDSPPPEVIAQPGRPGEHKSPGGPEAKTSGPKGRAGPPGRRPPAPKPRSGRRGGDPAGPREAQRGGRHEARAIAAQRRKPAAKGGRPQAQRGQREPAEARSAAQGPSERAGGKARGPGPPTERSEGGRKRRSGPAKRGPGAPPRSGRARGQGPRRKSGREAGKKGPKGAQARTTAWVWA